MSDMTLLPLPRPSDHNYPLNALYFIDSASMVLLGASFTEATSLYRLLEQMKYGHGFDSIGDCEISPNPLYWREPVWLVIDEVLELVFPEEGQRFLRVDRFQEALKLCVLYEKFESLRVKYLNDVKALGLVVEGEHPDVIVSFSSGHVGKDAVPIVKEILEKLLPAVTAHVEMFTRNGSTYDWYYNKSK